MNISDEAVRKAAILVAALDTAAADALLDSMDEALAARVRASYMELDEVDAGEQRRVIEQFLGGHAPQAAAPAPAAVATTIDELSLSSAVPLAEYLSLAPTPTSPPAHNDGEVASFESATGEQLVAALRHEHSQTIAVVLASVAPATAAAALARLSAAQQADVARRIVELEQVDGEALRELQAGLRESLDRRLAPCDRQQSGLEAMQRIWREASPDERSALERSLRQRDARLLMTLGASASVRQASDPADSPPVDAEQTQAAGLRMHQPTPPAVAFEALAELDSASLGRVLQRADGRVLLLALAGASAAFIDRVYRQLPRREAQRLRKQIEQQGPIALRDVAEAQRRLALLAGKLAAVGEIEIPGAGRCALAA